MTPPPHSRRALLKSGLAVAAAGGLAGCGADALPFDGGGDSGEDLPPMNWPSLAYQYNPGHTGTDESDLVGLPRGAEVYWREAVDGETRDGATPALLHDNLFVPTSWGLTAFSPREGERPWRQGIDAGELSSPAIADVQVGPSPTRRVLVGGDGLYAFGMESGDQLWHVESSHLFASPVEHEGVVYASSTPMDSADEERADGTVWSFEFGDGSERWNYPVGAEPSMPAASENAVFVVASEPGEVHAVDAETGDELWVEEVGARGVPTVRDGRVYVGTDVTDPGIAALDAGSGEQLWHESTDGVVCRSVAATEDTVYATHSDPGGLVALDAAEGSVEWERQYTHPGGSPVVIGGRIYTGSEIGARCFYTHDGAEAWTVDPAPASSDDRAATEVVSVPLVFNNIAFVVTGTGDVCALGPPEGWTEVQGID